MKDCIVVTDKKTKNAVIIFTNHIVCIESVDVSGSIIHLDCVDKPSINVELSLQSILQIVNIKQ